MMVGAPIPPSQIYLCYEQIHLTMQARRHWRPGIAGASVRTDEIYAKINEFSGYLRGSTTVRTSGTTENPELYSTIVGVNAHR